MNMGLKAFNWICLTVLAVGVFALPTAYLVDSDWLVEFSAITISGAVFPLIILNVLVPGFRFALQVRGESELRKWWQKND